MHLPYLLTKLIMFSDSQMVTGLSFMEEGEFSKLYKVSSFESWAESEVAGYFVISYIRMMGYFRLGRF